MYSALVQDPNTSAYLQHRQQLFFSWLIEANWPRVSNVKNNIDPGNGQYII